MIARLERGAARAARPWGRRRAAAGRDVASARRSVCCWRRSAARSRPTSATWNRCSTRSSATARSARSSRRSPRTASRSAARCACWASTTRNGCSGFAKRRSTRTPIRRPRCPTRTSSSWPKSLSGLGFYIEAVEQQRPDRERLIAPLLAKRLGEAPKLAADDRSDSVEAAVEGAAQRVAAARREVRHAPADAAIRESLRAKLASLRDDAELIGDEELIAAGRSRAERARGGWRGRPRGRGRGDRGERRCGAGPRDLRGNATAARHRRDRTRRGARSTSISRRRARCSRRSTSSVMCSKATLAIARRCAQSADNSIR